MTKHVFSFAVDTESDREIYQIVQGKPSGERSAYIRSCIEFYERHKGKDGFTSDQVMEMFKQLMSRLEGGLMTFPDDPGLEQDAIFEEMLSQFD